MVRTPPSSPAPSPTAVLEEVQRGPDDGELEEVAGEGGGTREAAASYGGALAGGGKLEEVVSEGGGAREEAAAGGQEEGDKPL